MENATNTKVICHAFVQGLIQNLITTYIILVLFYDKKGKHEMGEWNTFVIWNDISV